MEEGWTARGQQREEGMGAGAGWVWKGLGGPASDALNY